MCLINYFVPVVRQIMMRCKCIILFIL